MKKSDRAKLVILTILFLVYCIIDELNISFLFRAVLSLLIGGSIAFVVCKLSINKIDKIAPTCTYSIEGTHTAKVVCTDTGGSGIKDSGTSWTLTNGTNITQLPPTFSSAQLPIRQNSLQEVM